MNSNNFAIIMAGGIGSRFWPYSRIKKPKQFQDFMGSDYTLIQLTFNRLKKIIPRDNIFILTNLLYQKLVKEQIIPSGHIPENYIVERLNCDSHDGRKIPITIIIEIIIEDSSSGFLINLKIIRGKKTRQNIYNAFTNLL